MNSVIEWVDLVVTVAAVVYLLVWAVKSERRPSLSARVANLERTVAHIDKFLSENEPGDLLKRARLDAHEAARSEMKRAARDPQYLDMFIG